MKVKVFNIVFICLMIVGCKKGVFEESQIQSEKIVNNKIKGCGFTTLIEIETTFLPAEERVSQIIENIISYSGLPNNFKVYRADYINNAFATIIENERIIVYDSKLFNDLEWYSDTFWTSVSILSHEIGHHLSGHTETGIGSNHKYELEADQFSGFVLYKMGATKAQALKAMQILALEYDSDTHPAKNRRLKAIEKGWEEANSQRYKSALPPAPTDKPSDFYKFTKEMVVAKEHLYNERYPNWFNADGYLYGVVTDVAKNTEYFQVRIIETSNEFSEYFRNLNGENWDVSIESPDYIADTEMCHACSFNLRDLLTPGRRIKFSMVESLPDHGTSLNGVWFLTYLEALSADYFY